MTPFLILTSVLLVVGLFAAMRPLPPQPRPTLAPPIPSAPATTPPWRAWQVAPGIHGYAWEVAQPRGFVLLQHGYADYALRFVSEYHQLIPKLCAQGFSVYAMDLHGHGFSTGARGVLDVRQAVADHVQARRLLATNGLPVFLIGHSLGGLITAASVCTDADNLAGVILMSPALPAHVPGPMRWLLNLLARITPHGAIPLPAAPESGLSRDTEYIARATADPIIYHANVTTLTAATALAVATTLTTAIPHWRVPTLIQHGSADTWADPRGSSAFAAQLTAGDCTLITYPDGRHNLLCDDDQVQAYHDIRTWLEGRVGDITPAA